MLQFMVFVTSQLTLDLVVRVFSILLIFIANEMLYFVIGTDMKLVS